MDEGQERKGGGEGQNLKCSQWETNRKCMGVIKGRDKEETSG